MRRFALIAGLTAVACASGCGNAYRDLVAYNTRVILAYQAKHGLTDAAMRAAARECPKDAARVSAATSERCHVTRKALLTLDPTCHAHKETSPIKLIDAFTSIAETSVRNRPALGNCSLTEEEPVRACGQSEAASKLLSLLQEKDAYVA